MTDQNSGEQYGVEAWARVAFVNEVRRSMFEDHCLPVISPDSAREVFDEWLQGVKAAAYDEGYATAIDEWPTDGPTPNPYRKDTP